MSGLKDFIEAYAMKRGISKVQAEQEVRAFLDVLKDKLKAGGVAFKGIFTLKKVVKKGRSGKCNGHEYTTEDKNSLKLTVGAELEQELNQ